MVFPQTILPIRVEAFIDTTWTDITQWVQTRGDDGIPITYGRANEAQATEPARLNLNLDNRDGRFSPRNPNGPYFGKIGRNTPIRVSVTGSGSLLVNAATGVTPTTAYVRTPDAAALDIVGDIDIRADVSLDSWRAAPTELVSKWTETGNQRSYMLAVDTDGRLRFLWSSTGTGTIGSSLSSRLPIVTGRLAVRVTFDVDNGSGGRLSTFYTAPSMAGPWTQLSTALGPATTSLFAGTSQLYVGDNPGSTYANTIVHGRIYAAQVYNGIAGTLVANPDFTTQAENATSFVDSTGKTWTLSGDVALTDRDPRFTGEVTQWPQKWDPTGADVYVPAEASGVLRRLGQGDAPLQSTLKSGILSRTTTVAYWPLEDGEGAESAAAAIPRGSPMLITSPTAPPSFAADSSFDCSAPIAVMNGASLSGPVRTYGGSGTIGVQFLMHVPDTGDTDGAVVMRINASGAIARWDLIYSVGGALALNPYDNAGTFISGGAIIPTTFNVDGKLLRVTVEMSTAGFDIYARIATLEVGAATGLFTDTTVTTRTVGRCTRIQVNPQRKLDGTSIGHISVDSIIVNLYAAYQQLNAYKGELVGNRIKRLCTEKGLSYTTFGDPTDTALMGPQRPEAFLELIQECVDVDQGFLIEPRGSLGLGYIPKAALYRQPADITLDYTAEHLSSLEPTEDDQSIRNDITGTRPNGSSFRATLDTGRMSVLNPPNGVGTYDTAVSLNVVDDAALQDTVGWLLRLGTVDEARFPVIDLNLARAVFASNAALTTQAVTLDIAGRLTISHPPAWLPPEMISQVVTGYTEVLGQFTRTLALNCVPSAPYDTVGLWSPATPGSTPSRYSSDGTTLELAIDATTPFLSFVTPTGPLWITATAYPNDFPIPVIIEGEVMSIDAITSGSSPQPANATRSVNGVVKSHPAGAIVELFPISYYAGE